MNQPIKPETGAARVPLWRIAGTVLSLALLGYLIYKNWKEFGTALTAIPLQNILLAFALLLVSRVCVTARWHFLLRGAKLEISFWQSLRLTLTGLFAANFLPSTVGGDLARLAGAVYLGMDAGLAAASLVVDRLVGMAGMTVMLPFGLAIIARPAAVLPSGIAAIPGLGWLWKKLSGFIRSAAQSSLYWIQHPASLGLGLLATFGHQTMTYLIIAVLASGAGQSIPFLTIGGLWSINYFVSLAPFAINGLGVQEVAIAYLYSHFGGLSLEAGLAVAVVWRILNVLASLPGAFFLPGILSKTGRTPEVKKV